jgi:hypothetical protein
MHCDGLKDKRGRLDFFFFSLLFHSFTKMAADNGQLSSEPLNRKRSLDDVAYVEQAGEETANDDGKQVLSQFLSFSPLLLSFIR